MIDTDKFFSRKLYPFQFNCVMFVSDGVASLLEHELNRRQNGYISYRSSQHGLVYLCLVSLRRDNGQPLAFKMMSIPNTIIVYTYRKDDLIKVIKDRHPGKFPVNKPKSFFVDDALTSFSTTTKLVNI